MLDLITVVFRDELPLLKIQAESINQYFSPADVSSITVIVNDEDDIVDLIDTAWWKQHQSIVKIKPCSKYQYTSCVNGWENQQLLKLLAAGESACDWSMVLDAKTWFVQAVDAEQLFDTQGRAHTGFIGIFPQFVESRQFVENFYNIELKEIIGPSGVPFLFHTKTVASMIDSIDNFPDFFQTALRYPHLTTEFYFYSGYVLSQHQTYSKLYSPIQRYNCLNLAEWQTDEFDNAMQLLQIEQRFHTASIHRRTYSKLTQQQILTWVLFLKESNLVTDERETQDTINTYIK